jgi:hypothetical protein
MLESAWDTWFLAKATAYGRKMFQTKAFQEVVVAEEFPGCKPVSSRPSIAEATLTITIADTQTDDQWIDVSTLTLPDFIAQEMS